MKTHLIIGRNIDINVARFQAEFNKNGHSLVVHSDAKNLIDCKALKLPNNAHVIINADGSNTDLGHFLDLCDSQDTNIALQNIAAKKIVNIELMSCYGGAAISSIKNLNPGSTLMTFVDAEHVLSAPLQEEVNLKIVSLIKADNPFLRFSYYLLLNPDCNQFAIKTTKNSKIFTSSIEDLQDYSTAKVKAWQKNKLLEFAKFCGDLKTEATKDNQIKIEEALALLTNKTSLTNWMNQFDTIRYKELLMINKVRDDDILAVDALIKSGVNIEATLVNGDHALHVAIQTLSSSSTVEFLLSKGAKLEVLDNEGNSALWIAAEQGILGAVKFLWSKGAKLDIVNKRGDSVLWVAAQEGHLDVVKFLWNKVENLDMPNYKGVPPLLIAIQQGHFNIVKFLVNKGAQLDFISKDGATPLLMAAQLGSLDLVKFIYSKTVQLEIADSKGITPLLMATQLGHVDIVEYLISKGAEVNTANLDGGTPFVYGGSNWQHRRSKSLN
jgi:ankyrin repeat protein